MRGSGEEEETEVGEKERMRKGRRGMSKICHVRLQYLYDCTLTGDSFLKDICIFKRETLEVVGLYHSCYPISFFMQSYEVIITQYFIVDEAKA